MKKILIVEYKDEQEFSEMLGIASGFDMDIHSVTRPTEEEIVQIAKQQDLTPLEKVEFMKGMQVIIEKLGL